MMIEIDENNANKIFGKCITELSLLTWNPFDILPLWIVVDVIITHQNTFFDDDDDDDDNKMKIMPYSIYFTFFLL